ncbi:hypothetical protein N9Z73_00370 [bacterium]|nr:hypothetical protein [bacterium]
MPKLARQNTENTTIKTILLWVIIDIIDNKIKPSILMQRLKIPIIFLLKDFGVMVGE